MKSRLILLFAYILTLSLNADLTPEQYEAIDNFRSAGKAWSQAIDEFTKSASTSTAEITAKADAAMKAWAALPVDSKSGRLDLITRFNFYAAQACAKKGLYQESLVFLNREMWLEYMRTDTKTFLSGRNAFFFQDVVKLEAAISSHLGHGYYPEGIDHYFMPLGSSKDGLMDRFVAMYTTDSDEQYNITIPPFPKDQDRKILYLLAPDQNGNYGIVDSIQLIGFIGKKVKILFSGSSVVPLLTLSGITSTVEMKEGVPFKYMPVASHIVKIEVLPTGFHLIP